MPDMNNHTVEGLRAQRDALLGALKELEFDEWGWCRMCGGDKHDADCTLGLLIATIEGLPNHPLDEFDGEESEKIDVGIAISERTRPEVTP